jgi:hypothetical protein
MSVPFYFSADVRDFFFLHGGSRMSKDWRMIESGTFPKSPIERWRTNIYIYINIKKKTARNRNLFIVSHRTLAHKIQIGLFLPREIVIQ